MRNKVLYVHRNDVKGIFYVGIGSLTRAYSTRGRNQYWERIVNKYGYTVEILEDSLTWDEACEKEIYLISYYGRLNNNTGTLVNMTDGGDGVINLSEESRKKMSDAKIGKDPWNKGIPTNVIPWNKGVTGYMGANRTSFHSEQIPWNKGLVGVQTGENIGTSKLREEQVLEIRSKFKPYKYTRKMLSLEYNVSEATIKDIILKKSWKHVL